MHLPSNLWDVQENWKHFKTNEANLPYGIHWVTNTTFLWFLKNKFSLPDMQSMLNVSKACLITEGSTFHILINPHLAQGILPSLQNFVSNIDKIRTVGMKCMAKRHWYYGTLDLNDKQNSMTFRNWPFHDQTMGNPWL